MQSQIPENWQKVKLGEVALLNPLVSVSKNEDCLYIPMEDLDWNKKFVRPQISKAYKGGAKFIEDDVLFARITPCLENGKIGRARGLKNGKGFGSTEYFVIRGKEGVSDTDFLYYLCRTHKIRQTAINSMLGASGRQRANIDSLETYELEFPDFSEQKRISSTLAAFDGKIEVNNKIAKTLELMAQAIFKEWFVKFKFPGYEKIKFVDSEIGKVPCGWNFGPMIEFVMVVLGGTPSRLNSTYWNGDIPWINSGEVNKFRIISATEYITEKGLSSSSARMMPRRSTLMAITGATLGQVSLTEIEVCANQSVVGVFDEKAILNNYLYLCILSNIKEIINNAGGGAQQHINKEIVEEYPILIPVKGLVDKFNNVIGPVFDRITTSVLENEKLIKMRDLLLPKLMKGEIRI